MQMAVRRVGGRLRRLIVLERVAIVAGTNNSAELPTHLSCSLQRGAVCRPGADAPPIYRFEVVRRLNSTTMPRYTFYTTFCQENIRP
jgi:hypothetical protein